MKLVLRIEILTDVEDTNPLILKSYPQHEVSVADRNPHKVKNQGI
jgi:hypothetical protein